MQALVLSLAPECHKEKQKVHTTPPLENPPRSNLNFLPRKLSHSEIFFFPSLNSQRFSALALNYLLHIKKQKKIHFFATTLLTEYVCCFTVLMEDNVKRIGRKIPIFFVLSGDHSLLESERAASLPPRANSDDALCRLGAIFSIEKSRMGDLKRKYLSFTLFLPRPAAHQVKNPQISSRDDAFFPSQEVPLSADRDSPVFKRRFQSLRDRGGGVLAPENPLRLFFFPLSGQWRGAWWDATLFLCACVRISQGKPAVLVIPCVRGTFRSAGSEAGGEGGLGQV